MECISPPLQRCSIAFIHIIEQLRGLGSDWLCCEFSDIFKPLETVIKPCNNEAFDLPSSSVLICLLTAAWCWTNNSQKKKGFQTEQLWFYLPRPFLPFYFLSSSATLLIAYQIREKCKHPCHVLFKNERLMRRESTLGFL